MNTTPIISNEYLERVKVDYTTLLLDNKNPRFHGEDINREFTDTLKIDDPRVQEYLRQTIFSKYNVQDLISSIVETGFLKLDPIIAVKEKNYYRVVEGNRRLSAIKTIHGHVKRKTIEVSQQVLKSISEIEIVILKDGYDESTIWMLQGIRHVSGIRDWGPFQQAELIKNLHEIKKMTYKQIGSVIGLSPARVTTILKAYCGVIQMMTNNKWSQHATPELFSHFEQAYVRAPVREWLGWNKEKSTFNNEENLELFYKWIVHSDPSIPREKIKSRDVRDKLPFILEHPEAKELMTSDEVSIDEAYSVVLTGNKYRQEFENTSEKLLKCLDRMKKSFKLTNKEKDILRTIKTYVSELIQMKILLVEPKSSTTYPPMGLMKFSRYHKLKGDHVSYVVGKDKTAYGEFWDKIYITSVFTYDFDNLIDTIQYYSGNLFNFENIFVGGIAATLLKDKIKEKTGVKVHQGLHDEPDPFLENLAKNDARYRYLLACQPSIDNLPPDYGLVDNTSKYSKITDNSFFLFSTKGCPNSCSFCAVKTLEPAYVDYIPLTERVNLLRSEIGDRAGLLLLDNNIAASKSFYNIIAEIADCGYGAGEKMSYIKNGRKIYKNRFVDFNQGVDLRLLDKDKMNALSRIAINPLRLAFDNASLTEAYKKKAQLAIECGINKLSNYMLYNYKDKPEDLYTRMEVNTDIVKCHGSEAVKIFSFPMRYSPIDRIDRTYLGEHWQKRQIRAIQLILNATHGIVSHSLREYKDGKGFFYRAFGSDLKEFVENLWMPFHYLINRDYFELEKSNIKDWRKDFRSLPESGKIDFMQCVKDGVYAENFKTKSNKLSKLLEHYHGEHTQVLPKKTTR